MTTNDLYIFNTDKPDTDARPRAKGLRIRTVGEAQRPAATPTITQAQTQADQTIAAIRAENTVLTEEIARQKKLGLIADLIPLDRISTSKLIRDRSKMRADPELAELKASILDVGLSNPIRVEADGNGGIELIQGFRRLSAYRALLAETDDAKWDRIPAVVLAEGENAPALYRQMVDENLVRKDLSFAEMAMMADAYAADPSTGCHSPDEAVDILFRSAGSQKRSYIRSFVELMVYIDKYLRFPHAISRNLGLTLRKRLQDTDGLTLALQRGLKALDRNRTEAEELALLRRFAQSDEMLEGAPAHTALNAATKKPASASTVFRMRRPGGEVKCTASNGRLVLKAPEDFTSYDPRRLTQALEAFYSSLA